MLKASDFPATVGVLTELACRLEAAFARDIDPIPPRNGSPPRAANSAMVARERRILFMVTPFLVAFQASDVRFTYPCKSQERCSQSMGPSDYRNKCTGNAGTDELYLRNT